MMIIAKLPLSPCFQAMHAFSQSLPWSVDLGDYWGLQVPASDMTHTSCTAVGASDTTIHWTRLSGFPILGYARYL
jgi:hypothetical protein